MPEPLPPSARPSPARPPAAPSGLGAGTATLPLEIEPEASSSGILSTIGRTPLIPLRRAAAHLPFAVFAKLEGFNPGGSIKDRAAQTIVAAALARGEIGSTTTIVESSSGNMGIGLAQVARYFGMRFICVVDPTATRQNVALLRAYGAEIDLVSEPDPANGGYLAARLARVSALLRTVPRAWWPNQYANLDNARAHHGTMAEVLEQLQGEVDHVFCATSTCGTMRGCAEHLRARGLRTKVWAVDAIGSVIFGAPPSARLLPGHGASRRPELFRADLADACVHVSDRDCVLACRRLLRREAILAGGSSGGVLAAIEASRAQIRPGAVCVAILPDRGERYLDTIYSDAWVRQHFGGDEDLLLGGASEDENECAS